MLRMASLFDRKLAGPLSEGSATGWQLTYSLLKETRSRFVKSSSKDNFSVNNHWTFNFSGTYWRAKKIMNFHSWFWSSRWEWENGQNWKFYLMGGRFFLIFILRSIPRSSQSSLRQNSESNVSKDKSSGTGSRSWGISCFVVKLKSPSSLSQLKILSEFGVGGTLHPVGTYCIPYFQVVSSILQAQQKVHSTPLAYSYWYKCFIDIIEMILGDWRDSGGGHCKNRKRRCGF